MAESKLIEVRLEQDSKYWDDLAWFCQSLEEQRLSLVIPADNLAKANTELTAAAELHKSGEHRFAFQLAVSAATRVFASIGASSHLLEPYRHLSRALRDLDNGSIDPSLVPTEVANRRIEPASLWSARALLALSLEHRIRSGESISLASKTVCDAFFRKMDRRERSTEVERKRLKQWRYDLKRNRGPDGDHRALFEKGIEKLAELTSKSDHRRIAERAVERAFEFQLQVPGKRGKSIRD